MKPAPSAIRRSLTPAPINLLLVDDEPKNLVVLENVLQAPEHRLVRATGAEEALLSLLKEEFAVIVLDVQMPGIGGLELAHLIKQREKSRHTPIIFLTAYYQDEQRMLESYNIGAVDYLTKPVNPQVLRSKVAVFVELHRKTAELRASNEALGQEIRQRHAAERALREMNDELEARVEARTAALREARDVAERSERAKDDFLAALSHELRTPLNPVLLLASDSAENAAYPAEAREYFLTIRKHVELEARLIDDLLDLTRITRGKMPLEIKTHDVHEIVRDAIETVAAEIREKQIELRLNLRAGRSHVAADYVRLQQVFWNLLRNAVKFTPERGRVTIESANDPAQGGVRVTISDTGIGLKASEIPRIFEAFAQGDHASINGPHRFGGLGLGLAISRSLVEHQHGRLVATSEGAGRGATFTVELPLSANVSDFSDVSPPRAALNDGEPGLIAPAGGRRRIMLVEDHEPTQKTLALLLQRRQYDVATASSLADARRLMGCGKFDVLISDIGLPDGSGFELLQEMKAQHDDVRGIALTGYGMEEDVGRSMDAGFAVHLTKPVGVQSLERALAELTR